jgi:hypothetical protein
MDQYAEAVVAHEEAQHPRPDHTVVVPRYRGSEKAADTRGWPRGLACL